MEDGTVRETPAGTPQGGVISPLLANIYLHLLDRLWEATCGALGVLIRYADDFVVMSPTESKAKEALRQIQFVINKLGLTLHPEKTRMVDLRRSGLAVKQIIVELTPVRRGWGNYFRRGILRGTVRYAAQATSPRSSVNCVRENRTHSLKGGSMETDRHSC